MDKGPRWKYVIYVLMVVYVCFISIHLIMLNNSMENSEKYTRGCLDSILRLRETCIGIQKSLPALLSSSVVDLKDVKANLEKEGAQLEEGLKELDALLGDKPELMRKMQTAITNLRNDMQNAATELKDQGNYQHVVSYALERFLSQFENIGVLLNEITSHVSAHIEHVHASMHERIDLIILASIVAGAIIVIFTMLYDGRVELAGKEIAYRQEMFHQLANNIDEIFIIAKEPYEFEYVSACTQNILNISASDISADPDLLYALLKADDAKWLKDTVENKEREGTAELDVYVPSLNKHLKFRIYITTLPSSGARRFIMVISDQTETILHHQALCDALEGAEAATAAKSGFLSHMSHEIRTPMNAIIGMTTIALSRINDSERVKDCLGKISDSSRHLLGLINDVLDMSKIESGKLSITADNFNLHETIENINNIVRPQTQNRKQKFDIFLEDVDEENLVGDSMRVNQVLLNILSNALKFTPEGGSITMRLKQIEKKNGNVRIRFTIADTGIGMSEEYLQRLYHPFEQASDSTASKYGGTGLGMPITANLVTMMGGSINVQSKEGCGTTFFIELPFGISGEGAQQKGALPPFRLLVVDDDKGTCEHACHLLEKMGINADWTLSGEEAVQMAKDAHERGEGYEICLVDWTMPGMNGAETARAIRSVVGDDVLIIIISAYDWAPIEDEARHAGVDDFLAKPFFASTLFDALVTSTRRLDVEAGKEPEAAVKQGYDFSGKRALLVEDNEFNREIGQEFLEMVNIEVDIAENGKEAVDKVTGSPSGYYDVVLMDIQMPVMDGYEATRTIRASSHPEAKSMVILAMTANAFNEDVARAVAAGMNAHIAKPIDVNELYQVLAKYLQPQPEKAVV